MTTWKEAQEMLKQAQSPKEKAEALRAVQTTIPNELRDTNLVTMSNGGQNVVNLGNIANQGRNPEVYDRLKKLGGQ